MLFNILFKKYFIWNHLAFAFAVSDVSWIWSKSKRRKEHYFAHPVGFQELRCFCPDWSSGFDVALLKAALDWPLILVLPQSPDMAAWQNDYLQVNQQKKSFWKVSNEEMVFRERAAKCTLRPSPQHLLGWRSARLQSKFSNYLRVEYISGNYIPKSHFTLWHSTMYYILHILIHMIHKHHSVEYQRW